MEGEGSFGTEAGKAAAAIGAGAAGGATVYGTIGGIGIAAGGTAVGITLLPFMAIGAGLGLLGYGVYRFGKKAGRA